MGDLGYGFHFILLISSFFIFSSVHSCAVVPIPKTSVLNISASVKKASEFLSFSKKSFQTRYQELQEQQSNPSFSVNLYSRETLHLTPFKSYRDLTIARLARYSARVKFISRKLNSDNELSTRDLEIPLYGGNGDYVARIGIGKPTKQFHLEIDTGSDITWTQCERCTFCFEQPEPRFDPARSSSFKPLSCGSRQCTRLQPSACITNTCNYRVSYGDGSNTTGHFATETLTLGNTAINNVAIGCGLDQRGFSDSEASGLLGLGTGPLSFPSQIRAKSFSYCLVQRDSASAASTLEFNSAISSDADTVPLLHYDNNFYRVSLTGISIGGRKFTITSNGGDPGLPIIVDSGSTLTQLPSNIYKPIRDEFAKGVHFAPVEGVPHFDTCFDIPSPDTINVPSVAFHFGDKSMALPPKNYFIVVALDPVIMCFAFEASQFQIIGNVQQQGFRVSFDLQNSLIGFAANKC